MTPARAALVAALVAALLTPRSAPAATPAKAPAPAAKDAADPNMPAEREYSQAADLINHSLIRPITRVVDAPRLIRQVSHHKREAANVDADDQVRLPSTWWQPRLGFRPVSVAQMLKGPMVGGGPKGPHWTVTKIKTEGLTPGLQIKDGEGDKFLIKFDQPAYPEMATSTDAIGSVLFWAAGYNVPENTIAVFRPESLLIDAKTTILIKGRPEPLTRERLNAALAKVAQRRDGSIRCVASRFLDGKPLGPFKYEGRRGDDPEDLVPHEHRRELRGLWTIAAWLNHADIRGPNSLDTWVTAGGRSFVRHNLIDFGSILGSSAIVPHVYPTGTEYYLDYGVMTRQLFTLGLVPFAWESTIDPQIKSVGFVESAQFDPQGWRPDFPNPAFDERTVRDVRWGARVVAAFTDEHIHAAVECAHFSDPRATAYLTSVLIERRDKLVHAWLGTPLVERGRAE